MMDTKLQALPPLKRLRLLQQRQQEDKENDAATATPLCLPAKKRRESRDPSPFLLPDPVTPAAIATTTTYCLPAKKRVWALQPIDLNMEYQPSFNEEKASKQQEEEEEKERTQSVANFESESNKSNSKSEIFEEENDDGDSDDGIVCAVCQSTDGDPTDPIVFCDSCDLMVHVTCYGDPLVNGVPDGEWFCRQCSLLSPSLNHDKNNKNSNNKDFFCCLCPVKGGAMKPTKDGRWAHIVCALFVPEVFFNDPEGREGIDCSSVPNWRWKRKCYLCKNINNGCVIDCSEPKCGLAFHVTCGLNEDLCIEYREGKKKGAVVAGFCKDHTELWKKQQHTGKFKIVAREDK